MITNLLPAEATHTTLDLFKKTASTYYFRQCFYSSYSPGAPMLEFEVLGDRNNFIELQNLLLEIECKISRNNDGDLRTGTDATNTDAQYFSNNALYSLFSECTVSANGVKISNTNMRTKHSLKRNFLQDKLQKTHGWFDRDIFTRMSQLKLMALTAARTTLRPE